MSNKLLLVPSAKLVPLELQVEFGTIPTAMIPLASQPSLSYIIKPYIEDGYDVLVSVHDQKHQIDQYIERHQELPIKTFDAGETKSLGETILKTLLSLKTIPDTLVINFADTVVKDVCTNLNTIFYKQSSDVYRWTCLDCDNEQNILFNDKKQMKNGEEARIVVGVFSIETVALFTSQLKSAVNQKTAPYLDPFYVALQDYFNSLPASKKQFQPVQDWFDLGHIDTYYQTKKQFFINQRYFNEVVVDTQRGIVKKTSQDTHKFIQEINWYLRLPKRLQYIAPRIFDFNLDPKAPSIEMEFYGYPALNDIYLFGNYDAGAWTQIFTAVENLLSEMHQYKLVPDDSDALRRAMKDVYETKTNTRLQSIINNDTFSAFCEDIVVINNKNCFGLNKVLTMLPSLLESTGLYEIDHFTLLHGDLCFSNILYDKKNRLMRIIDPRGMYGEFDIYGDPRYDIAKLLHSIEGDYDLLSNGLFSYHWEGNKFYFSPYLDARHLEVKEIFESKFINKYAGNLTHVRLIESLLFLSMVPLHADRPASQLAFIARGLELFTTVLAETGIVIEGLYV